MEPTIKTHLTSPHIKMNKKIEKLLWSKKNTTIVQ